MKRGNILIIVVCILVVALILLLFYMRPREKHYLWSETYGEYSDQPFGTVVISKLLEDYFSGKSLEVVNNDLGTKLLEKEGVHRNYIFIGQKPYYTDSIFELLLNFVSSGNDAFLALKEIPQNFSSKVLQQTKQINENDSLYYTDQYGDSVFYQEDIYPQDPNAFKQFNSRKISMNFIDEEFKRDSSYKFDFIVQQEPALYDWLYFFPEFQNSILNYSALGTLYSENFCNFIQVPYGKGYFYIHTNPIVFSNYFQIQKSNVEYTSKVLSYLKPGDIIWDEYSKTYTSDLNFNNDDQTEGPLKFILSQTSLRWAWYCLLGGLLLFILFRTKRTQQSIRVMEPNENKSLEFVQTIGRMYYIRRNHNQLAQQKMKLFFHFIAERYQLNTQVQDEDFINKLHLKSEISRDSIINLFKHYKYINNTNEVTNEDLIHLHSLLDRFYKNCK